jgi:hypothetical protein
MPVVTDVLILWIVVVIQVFSAVSVVGARLSGRSWARVFFHRSFLLCLLAVGLATMVAIYCGKDTWLPSAATLGLLSVGGTLDLGHKQRAAAF